MLVGKGSAVINSTVYHDPCKKSKAGSTSEKGRDEFEKEGVSLHSLAELFPLCCLTTSAGINGNALSGMVDGKIGNCKTPFRTSDSVGR
jgi:hypothetical protein